MLRPLVMDVDHLMVHVHDADAAGREFEELGFTVTPKSTMAALGLSNRCVLFQPASDLCCNYIELMAKEDPARVPAFMHEVLGTAEGPVSLVMATPDVRAAADGLAGRGVSFQPPFDVERDWHLGGGIDVRVAFGVCVPAVGQSPLYWNLCEHRTRQHYVRPDMTSHANGAIRITAFDAVAPDPAEAARGLADDWSAKMLQTDDGTCLVQPGSVAVSIAASAGTTAPGVVAIRLLGLPASAETRLFGLDLKRA
ncbi:MAG: VOC family protein [Minwuia sp.]|nr:VOC family protein [Minwuia sp.]